MLADDAAVEGLVFGTDGVLAGHLGGTGLGPENEGLRQFKSRFGARSIELESAAFSFGSPLKKKVFSALRTIQKAAKRG